MFSKATMEVLLNGPGYTMVVNSSHAKNYELKQKIICQENYLFLTTTALEVVSHLLQSNNQHERVPIYIVFITKSKDLLTEENTEKAFIALEIPDEYP